MTSHSAFLTATFLALAVCTSAACAGDSSSSSTGDPSKEQAQKPVPVLVQVNSHGKVTSIDPGVEVRKGYEDLMKRSVQGMINGPAIYKGKPIGSQLIMYLVPETTKRTDGKFDIHYTSIKNQAVPSGQWSWVTQEDGRILLVSASGQSLNNAAAPARRTAHIRRGSTQASSADAKHGR